MGTDIHGWVEVQRIDGFKPPYNAEWYGVIKIDDLVSRNYDIFSCLFGVTSFASFLPISHARNLPHDISEEASADYLTWEDVFGETWVTWAEIAAVDWSEDALDGRPLNIPEQAAPTS